MIRTALLSLIACVLVACATVHHPILTPAQSSELQQGEHYFNTGFYKHALRTLLPLACDGVAQAQYAVGYMYYYGYGVTQDTDVGRIWIERAAIQNYQPAKIALKESQTSANNSPR